MAACTSTGSPPSRALTSGWMSAESSTTRICLFIGSRPRYWVGRRVAAGAGPRRCGPARSASPGPGRARPGRSGRRSGRRPCRRSPKLHERGTASPRGLVRGRAASPSRMDSASRRAARRSPPARATTSRPPPAADAAAGDPPHRSRNTAATARSASSPKAGPCRALTNRRPSTSATMHAVPARPTRPPGVGPCGARVHRPVTPSRPGRASRARPDADRRLHGAPTGRRRGTAWSRIRRPPGPARPDAPAVPVGREEDDRDVGRAPGRP